MKRNTKRTYIIADADHDLTLAQVAGVRVLEEARKIANELGRVVTVRDSLSDRLIATLAPTKLLVVCLFALSLLAGCTANPPAPTVLDQHPQLAADEALIREEGLLLAHYDAALSRAEAILQRTNRLLAAIETARKSESTDLASKARAAAIELEKSK
jgi:hypothetical protein